MAKTLDLMIRIAGKVDPSLAKAMGIAKTQTSGLAAGMSGFAKAAVAAAATATAAVAGMTAACVSKGAELEKNMSNVKTLLTGTAEEVDARTAQLTNDVLHISTRTLTATDEITAGLYQVISAFEDSADTASRLETIAMAAKAGNAGMTETTNMLAAVTKAYGDTTGEAVTHASDLAFETVRLGQTTMPELANGLQKATSAAALLGVSQEELFAGFATLTGVAGDTNIVGTGLKTLFMSFLKPSKKLTDAVHDLGYESSYAMVQEEGIYNAVNMLYSSMSEMDFSAMFSQRAINTAISIGKQYDVLTRKLGAMEDAEGATRRAFAAQIDNFSDISYLVRLCGDNIMQAFGIQILPYLEQYAGPLAMRISEATDMLIDKFEEWGPKIGEAFDFVIEHAPQVEAALLGIGAALTGMRFAPQISTALQALSGLKLGGFQISNMFDPGKLFASGQKAGGAILGGITAAVSGAPALLTNMKLDGAGPLAMLGSLFSGTKAANAAGAVGGYFKNIGASFKNFNIGPGLQGAIANGITRIKTAPLVQTMGGKLSAVVSGAGNALASAGNLASVIGGEFSGLLIDGITKIKSTKLVGGIGGVLGKVGGAVGASGLNIFGNLGAAAGVLGNIWGPIAGGFGSLFAGAAPIVGVISAIIAVVSILGDNIEAIRGGIESVFGAQGLAVFDAFTAGVQGAVDTVVGLFSPENLAAAHDAIEGIFGPQAAGAFDGLVTIAQSVLGVIGQIVTFATTYVKPIIQEIFAFITGTVLPGIMQMFGEAAPYIAGIISNLGTAIMGGMQLLAQGIQIAMPIVQAIISALMSVASVVVPALLSGFQAVSAGIMNVITYIQGIFDGLITFITGVFTGNWSQAWEGVKQIFQNAFDALVELCKTPINAVIGIINGVISHINGMGFTIPEWVPVVGGNSFTIDLPQIPMLAEGGFTNGPSIAGEKGMEAVISFMPSAREQNIANWQQAGQMLGVDSMQAGAALRNIPEGASLGGGTNPAPSVTFAPNITINGNASREDVEQAVTDSFEQFKQYMERWQRTQARTSY